LGGRGFESLRALRTLITLRGFQGSQRFQWGQWFRGRAGIDALVYRLHGLMEEEIVVVERRAEV
jgi:hypothetical protein